MTKELFATLNWDSRTLRLTSDGRKASIRMTGYEQNVEVVREDRDGPLSNLQGEWGDVMPRVLLWLGKADYVELDR